MYVTRICVRTIRVFFLNFFRFEAHVNCAETWVTLFLKLTRITNPRIQDKRDAHP